MNYLNFANKLFTKRTSLMKRLIIILALTITQLLPAQNTTPDMVVQSLVGDSTFSHAAMGIKMVRNGETLAAHDAHKLLLPASNMKLISTGTALYHFGTDYKFNTTKLVNKQLLKKLLKLLVVLTLNLRRY